jgi:hypothetical protein
VRSHFTLAWMLSPGPVNSKLPFPSVAVVFIKLTSTPDPIPYGENQKTFVFYNKNSSRNKSRKSNKILIPMKKLWLCQCVS